MRVGVITMLAAAALAGPGRASAQDGLRRHLEDLVATYRGVAGIAVRNLATSESVSLRGDETFPSASLIKVAILVTLLDQVHNGRMRLDERTTMVARDRVGGSGVLQHFASGTALTLEARQARREDDVGQDVGARSAAQQDPLEDVPAADLDRAGLLGCLWSRCDDAG